MVCLQNTGPRVSVVMAVYNGAAYLQAAIDSVLTQTFGNFEFLIVDDGSTDATAAILRQAAARDARISVVTQERSGIPRSLNRGVALARGTYIARQDADDISLPTRLAKQVDFLDRHPDVALVGTFVRGIDGHGNTMGDLVLPVDHDTIRQVLFQSYAFISPTFLIRRDALLTVGGYRTEFPVAEDTDLELRISERFRVANLPEMLYLYRRSPQSVTIHRSNLRQIYIEIARELARQRMVEGADILTPGGAVEQPPVQVAGDR